MNDWNILYETAINRHAHNRNANKKMCDMCRKYFYKKDMKSNPIGLFCLACHKKRFGEVSRYVKNQLGLPYD